MFCFEFLVGFQDPQMVGEFFGYWLINCSCLYEFKDEFDCFDTYLHHATVLREDSRYPPNFQVVNNFNMCYKCNCEPTAAILFPARLVKVDFAIKSLRHYIRACLTPKTR